MDLGIPPLEITNLSESKTLSNPYSLSVVRPESNHEGGKGGRPPSRRRAGALGLRVAAAKEQCRGRLAAVKRERQCWRLQRQQQRGSAAACQRGSAAARQRGIAAVRQRGSAAVRQCGSAAVWQRCSACTCQKTCQRRRRERACARTCTPARAHARIGARVHAK